LVIGLSPFQRKSPPFGGLVYDAGSRLISVRQQKTRLADFSGRVTQGIKKASELIRTQL
jgi:hypothetical protein